MEAKTPHTGGEPVQGEKTNRSQYTALWSRLQAIESHLLPFLILIDRVVKEVMR